MRRRPTLRARHRAAVLGAVVLAALLALASPRLGRHRSELAIAPLPAAAQAPTPAAGGRRTPAPARFGVPLSPPEPPKQRSTGRIVVRFEPGASRGAVARTVSHVNGRIEDSIGKIAAKVVDVPDADAADALEALQKAPAVAYAEPDVVVSAASTPTTPNDMLWPNQWGLRLIGVPQAWAVSGERHGVVIGVLDSGADLGHPDLRGAFVPGYDFVNDDADPSDDNGHGTAAAGVIAARANNGEGEAGVCPDCSIMPVKVLGATGAGSTSTLAAGIVWATDHGARVISMSLGAPATSQVLRDALAYATSAGVVLVAAAGNAGTTTPFYPAADAGVISVAATDAADTLYSWSNRGPWVNVAAPGCNIAPARGGSYAEFCGTSSATPVVAGFAGLALSLAPHASAVDVERALMTTTVPVRDVQHGRVSTDDMLRSLGFEAPPAAPVTTVLGTWRGRLAAPAHPRRVTRMLAAGVLTVAVDASPRAPLAVAVLDARGRIVARASSKPPLRVTKVVGAGRYSVALSGARTTYRMTLTHTTQEAS